MTTAPAPADGAATDHRAEAVALYREANRLGRMAVETAWKCGQALARAKAFTPHGQWLPWLESEGIVHDSASRFMRLAREHPEISQLAKFESVADALDTHKREGRRAREDAARDRRIAEAAAGPGTWRTAHCAVADLIPSGVVAPSSLDCVFTDPPYERAGLCAWRDLAEFCAGALKPGGQMFALTGRVWLPEVLAALDAPGLRWHWMTGRPVPMRWSTPAGCAGRGSRAWSASARAATPMPADAGSAWTR